MQKSPRDAFQKVQWTTIVLHKAKNVALHRYENIYDEGTIDVGLPYHNLDVVT